MNEPKENREKNFKIVWFDSAWDNKTRRYNAEIIEDLLDEGWYIIKANSTKGCLVYVLKRQRV